MLKNVTWGHFWKRKGSGNRKNCSQNLISGSF